MLAAATAARVGDPLAFYEIAATVIPVLFLAMLYEGRAFASPSAGASLFLLVSGCLIAIYGEAAAFHVIANRQPTSGNQKEVAEALWFFGLSLCAKTVIDAAHRMDRHRQESRAWALNRLDVEVRRAQLAQPGRVASRFPALARRGPWALSIGLVVIAGGAVVLSSVGWA